MTPAQTIRLARKHLDNAAAMQSSARMCLSEAVQHYDNGDYGYAKARALRSLAYSVGIFHADYQRAAKAPRQAAPYYIADNGHGTG